MERTSADKDLRQRIRSGKIRREDVTRRLAELAFGKANDCVRLALEDGLEPFERSETQRQGDGGD